MAIWQELVDQYGFAGSYESVKRFARKQVLAAGLESVVGSLAGFAAARGSGSVVTPTAGFAGDPLPQAPGGRTGISAAFKYAAAVSRRTPVAFWMRRSDQPNCPSAMTCFFFSSVKTLLTSEGKPPPESMS